MSHLTSRPVRIVSHFSEGARTRGWWGFPLAPAVLLSIGILIPGIAETPSKATTSPQALSVRTRAEVENISALIEALRKYAGRSNGKYPAKMEELVQKNILSSDEFSKLTRSPLDSSGSQADGYLYYMEGKTIKSPSTEVLIIGRNPLAPTDLRRAVGLQDGSVTWWKRPQVEAYIKNNRKSK